MVTEILDIEAINALAEEQPAPPAPRYRYIRPLENAANDLVEQIRNPEGRFMFNILPLDIMVRGIGPGDLCMVIGKSHSAKTQMLLNSVANNPQANILWVTPDEVAELVLMKLITMTERIDPVTLEEKLQADDETTMAMVRQVATERFPNLIVVDKTVDAAQIEVALSEACEHWNAPCDLVVYDYLELMPSEGGGHGGVTTNAQALKKIAKDHRVPMAVVHQSSRSGSKRGQGGGMDAMRFGGEAESTFVIECFRKMDDEDTDEYTREQHRHTVTASVVKNKRPPGSKGEVDLFIHENYGNVREIESGDVGTPRENEHRMVRRGGNESQSEMIARLRAERSETPTTAVEPEREQF